MKRRGSIKEIFRYGKTRDFGRSCCPSSSWGGIYSGVFTPTEAAAVSVIYALLVEMFIYREFGLKDLTSVCQDAAILSACLLFILSCAMTFIWLPILLWFKTWETVST